jgi:hypothetical protein
VFKYAEEVVDTILAGAASFFLNLLKSFEPSADVITPVLYKVGIESYPIYLFLECALSIVGYLVYVV